MNSKEAQRGPAAGLYPNPCAAHARHAQVNETMLRPILELPNSTLSHDTFPVVFRTMGPVAFDAGLCPSNQRALTCNRRVSSVTS